MKYIKILLIKLFALSCFIGANLLQANEGLSLKAKGKETATKAGAEQSSEEED